MLRIINNILSSVSDLLTHETLTEKYKLYGAVTNSHSTYFMNID